MASTAQVAILFASCSQLSRLKFESCSTMLARPPQPPIPMARLLGSVPQVRLTERVSDSALWHSWLADFCLGTHRLSAYPKADQQHYLVLAGTKCSMPEPAADIRSADCCPPDV